MGTSTNPVETVAIVDLGNDIQLTYSVSGYVYTLNKLQLRLKQTDKFVFITNADGFNNSPDNQVLRLDYEMVSSPVYASNDELFDGLMGLASSVSLGGSSGGGGGNNTWSSLQDFNAVPTVGTKNITVTGLSFTLEDGHVALGSIIKIDSSGFKETLNTSQLTVSGGVITLPKIDDFETGDTVEVVLFAGDKAYDEAGDQGLQFVTNQDAANWTSPEHLIDESNLTADTYRYVIPGEGFRYMSRHWKLVGSATDTVTMTMWATNNADADDTADADWFDVSSNFLGAANKASVSATAEENGSVNDTPIQYLKYMVKIVVTGGTTNAVDFYVKKYN